MKTKAIAIYVCAALISFLGSTTGNAQIVDIQLVDQENQNLFYSELRSPKGNTINYENIKGSPYYTDEFSPADVFFKNGKLLRSDGIRLNLYRKTLEFMRDGEILEMIHMGTVDKVKIGNEQIIFINEGETPDSKGFYKVEVDGKYQLLQFLQVTFFDATEAKSFYEDDVPAEFKRLNDRYYLNSKNIAPIAFENKKSFEKDFKGNFPELVKYSKENKLNPSKYKDLVQMVEYLNSL